MPSLLHLFIVFAAVYGAAYSGIELTRVAARVAAIWPANAIVLAVLLRSPRVRWPAFLVSSFLANYAADLSAGDAPLFGLALTSCNAVEILVAAISIRSPWGVRDLSFTNAQALLRFSVLCGGVAPAISATLAAAFLFYAQGSQLATTWLTWFAADALGMVIVAPVLISANRRKLTELLHQGRLVEAVIGSAILSGVVAFVFMQSVYPFTYLCMPLLMLAAFRFGFVGAASGLLLTAVVSVSLTAHGDVPFAFTHAASMPERILLLQAFLFVMTFTALPVGVTLEKRAAAEKALLAAQGETATITEHMIDGLVTFDENGVILNFSGPTERIFGYAASEIVGRSVDTLLFESYSSEPNRSLSALLRSGQAKASGLSREVIGRRSDGSKFPIDLAIGEIPGEPGHRRFVGTVRDVTERKRTEEALRLSEERLGQAIRVSHIGIFDHDQRADTIYWSPEQRKIYGWTPDEPVTLQKYFDHVHPEDREYVIAAVRRAHDPKVDIAFDIEHRILCRDGEVRWLSTRAQTFFEGEGEACRPVRTVGAVLDITDTKKASAQLEFANNLLTTQIENSPDGILVADADRNVVLFNRRFGELWKIPQEIVAARVDETILRTGAEQVKDPERFYARVMYLYDHPEEVSTEDIEFKDGRIFERHSTPMRDFSGRYLGRLWIFHDITERKRAEAISTRLGRIVEDSVNEIYVFDSSALRFLQVNRGARENLGYSEQELLVMTPIDIKPRFTRESFEELIRPLREGRRQQIAFQTAHRRKDGSLYDVEVRLQLSRTETPPVFIAIIQDVTERMSTEKKLRQAQKMEAVGKLTGGVAHDFNNLLAIVGGNLELLEEKLSHTPDLHDLAERALRAVERGATLTRSLLAFSRQQPLSPRVVDLKKLVQEMADLVRRTVPETIEIEVVAGTGLWKCEADPGQLQNALLNLVANARDAMPEGGKLTIETANARLDDDYAAAQADVALGQYVMLAVSDTGQGMPPEVVARAFDPFFTTKGPGKGVGLGLSMVYGFAKQSNGYAKIYSEVGQGSTVRIYLPRSTKAFEEALPTLPAGDVRAKGETILVVEDDPDVRSLTCNLLRSFGYEVFEAGDPQQALRAVHETPRLALLLIDVVLPGGMNGPKLAEEVLRLRPEIEVLYMSGYTENAILHHGRLDPGVHLLQKPFTKRELAAKIRILLEGKST